MKDWPNLAAMFFAQAERLGDANFLWAKRDSSFKPLTWRQAAAHAALLAETLKARGVQPGDRVMLLSENRPEWLIADVGIMAAGAITVPSYVTNGASDHEYVLTHSGAKGVIVSTAALEAKLPAARGFTISMERDWDRMITAPAAIPACPAARTDIACLIYTSGTGGRPKGVMLSHGALLSNCVGANMALKSLGLGHEIFLSFLPLSHAYEHTAGQFFPIMIGAEIYYTDAESLAADLKTVRPTIMTSVPRLYETMHGRITRGVKRQGGMKAKLFARAIALGLKKYEGEPLSLGERVVDLICDLTVRKAVRQAFGGRMKAMVSGGAPLNPDIGKFFTALGLTILQGYGQTESAPIVSVNVAETNRVDTVGRPMTGVEVKIAEDGEILSRGPHIMKGYYNKPEATAEAIDKEGWFHTGDIGHLDKDGYLAITDRKKDLIVLAGGKKAAPQPIENELKKSPFIGLPIVLGDRHKFLAALIVPNFDRLKEHVAAGATQINWDSLDANPEIRNLYQREIDAYNTGKPHHEQIRAFAVLPKDLTIEDGSITPTLKVKRRILETRYQSLIEAMYQAADKQHVA
jgi:long-chain acyl-CoA synthetase